MSKNKKLLKESTVRRFMKLAGTHPLSENFFGNEEDELEEDMYNRDEPEASPADVSLEEPRLDGPPLDEEPPLDSLEEPEAEGGPMGVVSDLVAAAVQDALSAAVESGELEISSGEGEGELPVDEEPPMDAEPSLEEPPVEELEEEDNQFPSYDMNDVVNEVSKRVAARLMKETKKDKLADKLAEAIYEKFDK